MAHEGPTCVYVASYDDRASADLDLVAVKQLHTNGEISGFDAAVMQRDDKGHVHIHKDETGTHVGAWGGLVAGAVVGLLFPPAIIATAAIGAGLGAIGGHIWSGLSREDVKQLGAVVDDGVWGLIVMADGRLEDVAPKAFSHAKKYEQREVTGMDHNVVGEHVSSIVDLSGGD